jgi:hypothetical protein
MALYKHVASVAVSETFLHMRCVPTPITFLSFIRFCCINNEWKAYEVSYEFAVASFLE